MLRDGLLAITVETDKPHINSQLGGTQTHQLVEDLEGLLFRKTIEETYESNLIGEAEPVVGAPALGDLLQVRTPLGSSNSVPHL